MSERPVHTVRVGGVKATVWENPGPQGQVFYTTSIVRSYNDGHGWKETNTFMPDHLPKLELASRKAYEFIHLESRRANREHAPDPEPDGAQQSEQLEGDLGGDSAGPSSFTEKVGARSSRRR